MKRYSDYDIERLVMDLEDVDTGTWEDLKIIEDTVEALHALHERITEMERQIAREQKRIKIETPSVSARRT